MSRTAYVIVAVELDDSNNVTSMNIDHESAPWAFSTKEDNVWDEEREEWLAGYKFESEASDSYNAAEAALTAAILAHAGTVEEVDNEVVTIVVTTNVFGRSKDSITVEGRNIHGEPITSMTLMTPHSIPEALDRFRRTTPLDTVGCPIVVDGEEWEES